MHTDIMPRARYERQIIDLDTTFGNEFEVALNEVIKENGDLGFFYDDQLKLIRDKMIDRGWRKYKRMREARHLSKALNAGVAA